MMKMRFVTIGRAWAFALFALAPLGAHAGEQSFTRTIKLKDRLDLAIASGAGTIQISQGPADRLIVTGHVKANDWRPSDDRLRDIAANPPIQQDGNIIRIGSAETMTHVIIDYEIEAPADSIIQASSSVGDIFDDGVGRGARLSTGAGDIHATGLPGNIDASSAEGNIELEQAGQGEVKATSGAGNLDLQNVHGVLRASTDGGSITVSGVPEGDWAVQTGRGNIDVALGTAACTLDAQTGDGLVESRLKVESADASDRHHLAGKINGGGHSVSLKAGQGDIRIR